MYDYNAVGDGKRLADYKVVRTLRLSDEQTVIVYIYLHTIEYLRFFIRLPMR